MSGLFYADLTAFAEQVDAFFDRHELLRPVFAQGFEADFAGLSLGFPDDQRETSPALVGPPQLGFEAGRGLFKASEG